MNFKNAFEKDSPNTSLSAQLEKMRQASVPPPNCQKLPDKPHVFDNFDDFDTPELDPKTKAALEQLAKNVADYGPSAEDDAKIKHKSNPVYWFLYDKTSETFAYYKNLIAKYIRQNDDFNALLNNATSSAEISAKLPENEKGISKASSLSNVTRKRKSRWDTGTSGDTKAIKLENLVGTAPLPVPIGGNHVTTAGIASGSVNSFSGQEPSTSKLTEDGEEVDLELFKKQILASQLAAKALAKAAKEKTGAGPSYEYDSDEDTEGGTFEHKRRMHEMQKTEAIAKILTEQAKGKHHIGDFLPIEEMDKFYAALKKCRDKNTDLSEYQENKLQADNLGFKMLQKMGWAGKGLGANEQGITAPINKGRAPNDTQGLGAESANKVSEDDDIFDVYRKRMMLAYKFRPNPLNNPRRPYY